MTTGAHGSGSALKKEEVLIAPLPGMIAASEAQPVTGEGERAVNVDRDVTATDPDD